MKKDDSLHSEASYDVVILYSGGADSRLLLELCNDLGLDPLCILVSYGQKHIQELDFARKILTDKSIDFETVTVTGLNLRSALTTGEKNLYEGVSEWNVPNRNMMMLSFACAVAESRNVELVWYGADFSDFDHLFPDCYQEWIGRFNKLLEVTTSNKIKLQAPLLGLTKEQIITLLDKKDIPNSEYFSGYGEL